MYRKIALNVRFFCISQKKAVPLSSQWKFLLLADASGMWRSPVAQRSGGPEVASSNLVIPTNDFRMKNEG